MFCFLRITLCTVLKNKTLQNPSVSTLVINKKRYNPMDYQFRFLTEDEDEVIEVAEEDRDKIPSYPGLMFRTERLHKGMRKQFGGKAEILNEGVDCRVLSPGKLWQKGKLKLAVIFYPEEDGFEPDQSESESPLDKIRHSIAQPD
jgi:hypothetical protein